MSENQSPAPIPEIVMIPIGDLYVPDWNPRKYIDEGEMRNLMAYREKGGQVPPILVWKDNGQVPQAIISGQRRVEADRRLGKPHIAAILMDTTLEESKIMAITSNEGAEVHWLDKYESWESFMKDHDGWSQERVATRLGVAPNWISRGYNLTQVLNANSRQLIKQQLAEVQQTLLKIAQDPKTDAPKKPKPWVLVENVAFTLTGFLAGRPVAEAQALAEKTLKVVMDHKLAAAQVQKLVEWLKAGNPPETFGSSPKTPKAAKAKATGLPASEALAKVIELAKAVGAAEAKGEGQPAAQERLDAYLEQVRSAELGSSELKTSNSKLLTTNLSPEGALSPKSLISHLAEAQHHLTHSSQSATPYANGNDKGPLAQPIHVARLEASQQVPEKIFIELLAGISVVRQIDTKIKKAEKITFLDVVILLFRDLFHILGWLSKHGFKLIWHILKFIWKHLKESVKTLFKSVPKKGFLGKAGRAIQLVVSVAILGFFGWFVGDVYTHGIFHPFRIIGSKIHSPKATPMPPTLSITQDSAASPTVQAQPITVSEVEPKKSLKPNSPNPQPTPVVAAAIPIIQPTPTVQNANGNNNRPLAQPNLGSQPVTSTQVKNNDLIGQVAGSVAKQAGTDIAGDVVRHLLPF